METKREDIRQAFKQWLNGRDGSFAPEPAFEAGVLWSEATLSTREKNCKEIEDENKRLNNDSSLLILGNAELREELASLEQENKELKAEHEAYVKTITQGIAEQAQEIESLKNTIIERDAKWFNAVTPLEDNIKVLEEERDAKDRELSELTQLLANRARQLESERSKVNTLREALEKFHIQIQLLSEDSKTDDFTKSFLKLTMESTGANAALSTLSEDKLTQP